MAHDDPDRYVDPEHGSMCSETGWLDAQDVIDHCAQNDATRDLAEGIRLALRAATPAAISVRRSRDRG